MIYSITLNPAIDRIIHVQEELVRGKNNRISKSIVDIGGKGTHVSIVLSILNTPNSLMGFVGEHGKDLLYNLLKKYGVTPKFDVLENESVRETYIFMDDTNSGSYMITETGPNVSFDKIEDFTSNLTDKLTNEDLVVFSGNPSKKMSMEEYTYILKKVKEKGAKIVVDASGEYLKAALDIQPLLIKPNQFELADITGMEINSLEDCIRAYERFKDFHIEYLVVSLGKDGSILFHNNDVYQSIAPKVDTINDTGCGDAFVGGLVYGLYHNDSIEDMLRLATAIGASKAMQETSSGFILEDAIKFKDKVIINKIG